MGIFNIFGSLFGYILWAAYYLVSNFGIAIIIFTLVFKVVLFPTSVKQQRSMAATAKLQAKQKEIKERYGNDKQKYNEEMQKLYAKENVKPFGGCLSSIFPMFIMLGIYYAVIQPLSNVIHISAEKVSDLTNALNSIPGVAVNAGGSIYGEIDILRIFDSAGSLPESVTSILTGDELEKVYSLSGGFKFLGLDLLGTPNTAGGWLLLIPILCLVTSVGTQIITMFMKGSPMSNQRGCMRFMFLALPLLTAWIAYTVPAAVGFYWIWSTLFGFAQTMIMTKFYSPDKINAETEARHVARLELDEKQVKRLY